MSYYKTILHDYSNSSHFTFTESMVTNPGNFADDILPDRDSILYVHGFLESTEVENVRTIIKGITITRCKKGISNRKIRRLSLRFRVCSLSGQGRRERHFPGLGRYSI